MFNGWIPACIVVFNPTGERTAAHAGKYGLQCSSSFVLCAVENLHGASRCRAADLGRVEALLKAAHTSLQQRRHQLT